MKNSGLFFEHGKKVFLFVFSGFDVIVVCFLCVWRSCKSVKNACLFPILGGLVGWLIIVLGLEGSGVFVFLVFVFRLFRFFCFVFVLLLDCFWCCSCFRFSSLVFSFFVFVFFGGLKGQVRWPKGPPHLALNPPYYCLVFFLFLLFSFFLFFVFVFFGGLKGQVRWPKGPPHLALNPPYFVVFCFVCVCVFFAFLSLLFIESPCFPTEKGHFCLFFCVSLCFSLAFCWPPPFSFSLSLSLSCFFLSSFLPVSHVSFWFLLFVLVLFAFCFKMFFCFCFSACCLVLSRITILDLFLFCSLFSSRCFCLFLLLWCLLFLEFGLLVKNISQTFGNCKKTKRKMQNANDILKRAVSTGVFTNGVFLVLVFLEILHVLRKALQNRGFSNKTNNKKNKAYCVKNWSKVILKIWSAYVAQQNWTSF